MVDIPVIDFDYAAQYRISNPKPLVTVLINNYNYGRYLTEAIESALAQTWKTLEIIVVDDGSTDDSRQILETYRDKLRIILKENGGQASAFNIGIQEAQGEIICFLDSDDFWYPEKVERVVAKYHEGAWGLVCHELHEVDINGNRINECLLSQTNTTLLCSGNLLDVIIKKGVRWMFSPTSGMSLPAKIARSITPIPIQEWRICADNPLAYAAICHAPVGVVNLPLSAYRIHGANGNANIKNIPMDAKLHRLIVNTNNYFFITNYLKKLDISISLNDPKNSYWYFRNVCLIAKEKPWLYLITLWRLNISQITDSRREIKLNILKIIRYLCIDALLMLLMRLNLPTPYTNIRYKFKISSALSDRTKKYLLDE